MTQFLPTRRRNKKQAAETDHKKRDPCNVRGAFRTQQRQDKGSDLALPLLFFGSPTSTLLLRRLAVLLRFLPPLVLGPLPLFLLSGELLLRLLRLLSFFGLGLLKWQQGRAGCGRAVKVREDLVRSQSTTPIPNFVAYRFLSSTTNILKSAYVLTRRNCAKRNVSLRSSEGYFQRHGDASSTNNETQLPQTKQHQYATHTQEDVRQQS